FSRDWSSDVCSSDLELIQHDTEKFKGQTPQGVPARQTLMFVNREKGHEHPGTQTQEVIRALIDRTQHCDACLRWAGNDEIIYHRSEERRVGKESRSS